MDYVECTDAAQQMRDRYPHGMPTKNVLEIVSAIADALDYAHERYLLHRDVKPANILLTDPRMGDRRILLADFGIARAANDINGLTATNVTVGSVATLRRNSLPARRLTAAQISMLLPAQTRCSPRRRRRRPAATAPIRRRHPRQRVRRRLLADG
jgi:serine/threonine protein kinase